MYRNDSRLKKDSQSKTREQIQTLYQNDMKKKKNFLFLIFLHMRSLGIFFKKTKTLKGCGTRHEFCIMIGNIHSMHRGGTVSPLSVVSTYAPRGRDV